MGRFLSLSIIQQEREKKRNRFFSDETTSAGIALMEMEKFAFRVVLLVVFAILMSVNVGPREEGVKDGFL